MHNNTQKSKNSRHFVQSWLQVLQGLHEDKLYNAEWCLVILINDSNGTFKYFLHDRVQG